MQASGNTRVVSAGIRLEGEYDFGDFDVVIERLDSNVWRISGPKIGVLEYEDMVRWGEVECQDLDM